MPGATKTTKRIVKARIDWLSLCPRGKNLMPVFYKAAEDSPELEIKTLLVKASEQDKDRGEITAAVYVPNVPDADGDFASAEIVKDMAYDFARNGSKLDLRHDETLLTKDQAFVAESFVIQKGDPRFAALTDETGKPVDPTGGWGVVVKLQDPALKALYKEGAWQGVSMGGRARREPDTITKETETMTIEEFKKAIEESNKTLVVSIASAVGEAFAKALPKAPETPKADDAEAPVFKGDPSDLKAVKAHRAKLERERLMKEIDWSDPEQVAEHEESLTKQAASGQPVNGGEPKARAGSLKDKIEKGAKVGSRLAQIANRARGYQDTAAE